MVREKRLTRYVAGAMVAGCIVCGLTSGNVWAAEVQSQQAQAGQLQEDSATGKVRLEAVNENTPDFSVYVYPEDGAVYSAQDISIVYGEGRVTTKSYEPFEQSQSGISYYILVDKSASISKATFEATKQALLQFASSMSAEDTLTLVTFGDAVETVCREESAGEVLTNAIQGLNNGDQNTLLFEAMKQTAEMTKTAKEQTKRKVGIVITDAEDFSQNNSTQKEALDALLKTGLPMYAMTPTDNVTSNDTAVNSMGEFVRSSGGTLSYYKNEEASNVILGLQDLFYQAFEVKAETESNKVDYELKTLRVQFKDSVQTMQACFDTYQEDSNPPKVKVKKKKNKNILTVTFNEKVLNADVAGNYEVKLNEKKIISDYTVTYSYTKKHKYRAVLKFSDDLRNGEYTISYKNITDDSMEKNPIKKKSKVTVKDGKLNLGWLGSFFPVILCIVFIGAAGVAVYVMYRNIKKRNVLVTVEDQVVLKRQTEKKHHVSVEEQTDVPGKMVTLEVEGAQKPIQVEVKKSIMVGRSDICDVYLDDVQMSRQHFVLYEEGNGYAIEDLQTTNGTYLNGKKIIGKEILKKGDQVQAGKMKITIYW